MATKKFLGTLANYGYREGIHPVPSDDKYYGPDCHWFVVTSHSTHGTTTKDEAEKLYKKIRGQRTFESTMMFRDWTTLKECPDDIVETQDGIDDKVTDDPLVAEDAPANAAGTGAVAGLGVGPQGEPGVNLQKRKKHEPIDKFAGADVFETDGDKVWSSRFGKNRYHRYSKYVGDDDMGESIRQHGRDRKTGDIVLRDQKTAVMTYLRRRGA